MGSIPGAGGTTTSFTKTPQAGDDCFDGYDEDFADVAILNVMQNDLGGNAKVLFSLDDGDNDSGLMSGYVAADLLQQDLARMESTSTDTSANGAKIWITSDGQVGYDAGTLSTAFRAELNSLAAGETAYDSFIYSIRLGNGTLSWARAYVEYTGTNDAPTVSAADNGAVVEDDEDPTLSDTGTITFDDVDLSDTHDVDSVTPAAGNTLGGTLTAMVSDAATGAGDGTVTWTYQVANSATQHLAAGESVIESFTVTIADNNGGTVETVIEVTVTGTNDDPTIEAAVDSGEVTEDGATTASGTIDFADVDLADVHTVDVTEGGSGYLGTFTAVVADASTGDGTGQVTWEFSVDNADLQHLPEDAVVTQTYTVDIDDGEGGTVSQTVTITVNGVNDEPTVTSEIADQQTDEDALYSYDASANFDDVDDGDTLEYSATGLPGWLTLDPDTGVLTGTPGNGDVGSYTITVTATDDAGETASSEFELTVENVNDAPVVSLEIADQSTDEDALYSYDASAHFADDDTIHGDTLEYSATGLPGWLTLDPDTGVLTGTPGNGDVGSYTITVTATDDAGETASSEFELTVENVNDAPEVTPLSETVGEDGPALDVDLLAGTNDDDGDTLTITDAEASITTDDGRVLTLGTHYTVTESAFALTATGFALFNDLNAGDDDSFVFDFNVSDGSDETANTLTVTVEGADDYTPPPVFNGSGDPNDFDNLGAAGTQMINGGNGNQTIYGGAGDDTLNGNNGNDTVYGGSGNDNINGNADPDTLYGGSGTDIVQGAQAADTIVGGYGADTLTGNQDNDIFLFLSELDTGDTITDFTTGDLIDLSVFTTNSFAGLLTSPNELGANEVGYMTSGGITTLFVDTDGDATVDMEIYLSNGHIPVAANFDFI